MYEHVGQIWWSIVVTVVFVAGSKLETTPECINCQNEHTLQPELKEYVKSQKIAHRLEYIKQQLLNTLHVKNASEEPPKFSSLPDFLVQKLVHEDTPKPGFNPGIKEDHASRKMVLFVEQENITCDWNNRQGVCLQFKLSEDANSLQSSSAIVWFHRNSLPIHDKGMHNFTIMDRTLLIARNRNGRTITSNYVTDKDGWYQIDVTELVQSWKTSSVNRRILMVTCDSCTRTGYATNATSRSSSKTSFLYLEMQSEENARLKRGTNCVSDEEECCREDLWIDFNILGIGFTKNVMNPPKFNAYVCRGTCRLSESIGYQPYATLKGKLKLKNHTEYNMLPTSCCTPTRFSDLPVILGESKSQVGGYSVPNVVVEACGCV